MVRKLLYEEGKSSNLKLEVIVAAKKSTVHFSFT